MEQFFYQYFKNFLELLLCKINVSDIFNLVNFLKILYKNIANQLQKINTAS